MGRSCGSPYRVTAHPVSELPNDSPVGDDRQIKTNQLGAADRGRLRLPFDEGPCAQ